MLSNVLFFLVLSFSQLNGHLRTFAKNFARICFISHGRSVDGIFFLFASAVRNPFSKKKNRTEHE